MLTLEPHVSGDSDYYVYTPSALARTLFFYPVCTGYFTYEPGYFLKRDSYDSFLVMLVTKGECTVTLNEVQIEAGPGDVVFLDCYAPHQYESRTGYESYWLHFDGQLCRNYYQYIAEHFGNVLTPRKAPAVKHALKSIYSMFQTNTRILEADISRYITDILTELMLSGTEKETAPKTQLSLSKAISYINEHFAEPITLDRLAALAVLSPYYFTRLFAKETGMTPHQYLITMRVNSAKFLLKTTSLPIKEIGFSCGFTSESIFCTTFRKREGITPSEYRFSYSMDET